MGNDGLSSNRQFVGGQMAWAVRTDPSEVSHRAWCRLLHKRWERFTAETSAHLMSDESNDILCNTREIPMWHHRARYLLVAKQGFDLQSMPASQAVLLND